MKKTLIAGVMSSLLIISPGLVTTTYAQTEQAQVSTQVTKVKKGDNKKTRFVPVTDDMRVRAIDIDPSLVENPTQVEGTPDSPAIPEEILRSTNQEPAQVDITSQDADVTEGDAFSQTLDGLRNALVARQDRVNKEIEEAAQRAQQQQGLPDINQTVTGVDSAGNVLPPLLNGIEGLTSLSSMDRTYDSDKVQKLIDVAMTQIGVPYVWGGTSPGVGLDCSGLTQWAYKQVGIDIPRVTYDQINIGTPIYNQSEVKAGDLVFPDTGHVGIAISSTEMIHAPQPGEVVKIGSIYKFTRAVRVL